MPTAAIYTRVSEPNRPDSHANQLQSLTEFCNKMGWETREYLEERSARTGKHRPVFDSMLQACQQRKIDVVVVWKLDRFARSVQDCVASINKLDTYGVRFIAHTQGIDTDKSNAVGRLTMHILAAMAEFESELISERVTAGIARRKAKGLEFGRPKRIFDILEVKALRSDGWSWPKIAKFMRVGENTLLRRLREYETTKPTNPTK